MGTVGLAKGVDGTWVALKVSHPHLLPTPRHRERLLRKAEPGRLTLYPHVVATGGAGTMVAGGGEPLAIAMVRARM